MTDQDKQTPSETPSETASPQAATKASASAKAKPKPKAPKAKRAKSGGRGWFTLLLILVVIAALIAGGYYYGRPYVENLLDDWRDLPQQTSALAEDVARLSGELDDARQANQQLSQQLQQARAELEQLVVDTAQRLTRRDDLEADRWPLEEALALLRLAERRLQLDGNTAVALNLLDAADQILADLTAAAVLPVRRQIADDRLALQSVDAPDINGLYFRLEAIDERLATFQWTPAEKLEPEMQPEEEAVSPWAAFRNSLGSLVTIRRLETDHQASPLLDDFELWRQRSRLLLEEVQLALLAGEQPLYDAALAQLTEQLTTMRQELAVEPLISELNSLAGTALNPSLPDIGSSAQALEDYMSRSARQNGEGGS